MGLFSRKPDTSTAEGRAQDYRAKAGKARRDATKYEKKGWGTDAWLSSETAEMLDIKADRELDG